MLVKHPASYAVRNSIPNSYFLKSKYRKIMRLVCGYGCLSDLKYGCLVVLKLRLILLEKSGLGGGRLALTCSMRWHTWGMMKRLFKDKELFLLSCCNASSPCHYHEAQCCWFCLETRHSIILCALWGGLFEAVLSWNTHEVTVRCFVWKAISILPQKDFIVTKSANRVCYHPRTDGIQVSSNIGIFNTPFCLAQVKAELKIPVRVISISELASRWASKIEPALCHILLPRPRALYHHDTQTESGTQSKQDVKFGYKLLWNSL